MADQKFDNYDRNLTPSEVGAREDREGENFHKTPENEGDIDTTGGYTSDREGKLNNYAIEPEMYIEEPGDLREAEEANIERRREDRKEINRPGGKGPGII